MLSESHAVKLLAVIRCVPVAAIAGYLGVVTSFLPASVFTKTVSCGLCLSGLDPKCPFQLASTGISEHNKNERFEQCDCY